MKVPVYRDISASPQPMGSTVKVNESGTSATPSGRDLEVPEIEYVNMANGWVVASLGWLIWAFIAGLNVYLIVMLGLGKS